MSRQTVEHLKLFHHIRSELAILSIVDHCMIAKHVKLLKSDHRLYMLHEYIHGYEMIDVINEQRAMSDESASFYTA
jgi:hypothetical protein